MFGENTDAYLLSQVGYGNRKWYISALYALKKGWVTEPNRNGVFMTPLPVPAHGCMPSVFAVTGHQKTVWHHSHHQCRLNSAGRIVNWWQCREAFGWMVGLNWKDAFSKATNWGWAWLYPATPQRFVTAPNDGDNFAIEAYYDFAVTDNITITPAVFWT